MSYFVLSSLSIFLNTNTNVATHLYPLNSDNNFISLFLIADSVSSSGSNEFKISTLVELAKPLKPCACFAIFTFFSFKKF